MLQEQYMFIYDAILESITCGNTQISAADLQRVVTKLRQRDPNTQLSGYEQQFKVYYYLILRNMKFKYSNCNIFDI